MLEFQGGTVRLPDSSLGGQIAGLVDFRRDVLDPTNRSVGQLATSLAFLANQQNAQGVDLYGNAGGPIFSQPAIPALGAQANTGTGTLTASIANIAALNPNDIEILYDGTNYTALSYSRTTGTGTANWALVTPTGTIPATSNLRIRFRQTSSSPTFILYCVNL